MLNFTISETDRKRLIALAKIAVEHFNAGDWQSLGVHTGAVDLIDSHDRLIRSLNFGDADYSGHAHRVLYDIVSREPRQLDVIEQFITTIYGEHSENVSTSPGSRSISFSPSVFEVPNGGVESDLVAVMSPFTASFEPVFETVNSASVMNGMRTLRAKDIWSHSVVIQDVFSLIYKAQIVVCDFTGKNPNVFYEAGIAHTLGKHVVPITQSVTDIPFDLQHHRYLPYLNNVEGRAELQRALAERFRALR